jgi:hypothetical protein
LPVGLGRPARRWRQSDSFACSRDAVAPPQNKTVKPQTASPGTHSPTKQHRSHVVAPPQRKQPSCKLLVPILMARAVFGHLERTGIATIHYWCYGHLEPPYSQSAGRSARFTPKPGWLDHPAQTTIIEEAFQVLVIHFGAGAGLHAVPLVHLHSFPT